MNTIPRDIARTLRQVYDPEIRLTFEPLWNRSRMSEKAMLELGLL